MGTVVEKKAFEERARSLGATNFRHEGRDWKLTFFGVDLTYMVTHGKHRKGNEVPIGGPSGIDHLANKLAEVAKKNSLPHSNDPSYFKKVLRGYGRADKPKQLEDYFIVLALFFIAYLMAVKALA